MDAEERYERFRRCIEELREANDESPLLVEGRRDERALRELGMRGEIWTYHAGRTVPEVAHRLAEQRRKIIVLLDWDRTGGHIVRRLTEQLHAQLELDLTFRKELAQVSQVKSVEDLPAALRLSRRRAEDLRMDADEA